MTTDFRVRLVSSYSVGAYLAINALPDAILVVDGKDCVVQKASQIQGNHDWRSTLLSADGAHRILTTHATPEEAWRGRTDDVADTVRYAVGRRDAAAVFLGAMRMASITDPHYEMILAEVAEQTGTHKPLVLLPTRSLDEDWLTGYADAQAALARELPLAIGGGVAPSKGVAIVGYLMDRNEEDHGANLRELRRLLEGIGAELLCTWLSGVPALDLASVGHASLIVSLPYAREAATILAERTGARLVETDLPMGLGGTERWLRRVAEALGEETRAEALLQRELAEAAPKLEWVVSLLLTKVTMAFAGDPHLMRGFLDMARELGIGVPFRVVWAAARGDLRDIVEDDLDAPIVVVDPREGQCREAFDLAVSDREISLVVGNSSALEAIAPRVAAFELGFPSFHSHALTDQPFLGFRGCLSLVARLVERLKLHELLER